MGGIVLKRELRVAPVRASHNPRSTMLERERESKKKNKEKQETNPAKFNQIMGSKNRK